MVVPVLLLLAALGGGYAYVQSRPLVSLAERVADSVGPDGPPGPSDAGLEAPFPDGRRRFRLSSPSALLLVSDDAHDGADYTQFTPLPGVRSLVGVTPEGRLILSSFLPGHTVRVPGGTMGRLTFAECGINGNLAPLSRSYAVVPPNGDVRSISLSPQGDRLLWVIHFTKPFPGTGRLVRRFPALLGYFPLRYTVGLWVSNARGQNLRPLGEQAIPRSSVPRFVPVPEHFRWTEDGQGVRFAYDGALYLIPAP